MQMAMGAATKAFRPHFTGLRALLEAHIDFEEVRSWGPGELRPVLLVGAVNVLNGHLAQFTSRASGLRIEHILARRRDGHPGCCRPMSVASKRRIRPWPKLRRPARAGGGTTR
jgi:hypothetical protein